MAGFQAVGDSIQRKGTSDGRELPMAGNSRPLTLDQASSETFNRSLREPKLQAGQAKAGQAGALKEGDSDRTMKAPIRQQMIWTFVILMLGTSQALDHATAAKPKSQATVSADANAWPIFRGDSQSRGVAATSLPENLELIWKHRVDKGAFEGTAAIVNGVVYIGDLDGHLFALDLETGDVLWKTKLCELGFGTSAAVRNDLIYVGDFDGVFFCVDGADGKLKWKFEAEAEINSSANFFEDKVLFGSQDASLYCLNAESGELAWKHTIQDQIRCMPSIVENRSFVAGCDARLHIIDLTKGEPIGEGVELDGPTGVTPAINGDHVYFGTESGTFFAINWRESEVTWKFRDDTTNLAFRSSAAVTDEFVVVGGRSKRVYGLRASNGEKVWEFVTKRNVDSSPVIAGDRVYVGAADGRLYCLKLKTGEKVWEYETGGRLYAAPAIAAGKLVIASDDGVIYCFGKKSSTRRIGSGP